MMRGILASAVVLTAIWADPAQAGYDGYFSFSHQQATNAPYADTDNRFRATTFYLGHQPTAGVGFAYHHDYRVFKLPPANNAEPASNGHVHLTGPVITGHQADWYWQLAPRIATSSNGLKHLQDASGKDVQLHGLALFRTDWGAIGLQADSRLGRYQPYPVVQYMHSAGPLMLQLGWPQSLIRWQRCSGGSPLWHRQPHPGGRCLASGSALARAYLEAGLAPTGGQWQVKSKDRTLSTPFRQQRWEASVVAGWSIRPGIELRLGGHYGFREEWRYRLESGERVTLSVRDTVSLVGESVVRF
ncbi:MAG: hypothetical protein LAT63_14825 [Marinobacter sp.]|nr:hypothetical protein [Marinobacter sp.]